MTSHLTDEVKALASLTPEASAQPAPGKIEFASYNQNGDMRAADGTDHMIWTIGIGKDHTATVYMHKDDFKAMRDMIAAEQPYSKALNARPFDPDNPTG